MMKAKAVAEVRPLTGSAGAEGSDRTGAVVELVHAASELVRLDGERAFDAFRTGDSRWRQDETYIFVLALDGTMVVHPDPALEHTRQLDLTDVNGKPIIRGLIDAAVASQDGGWYHYQWLVPGGLLPRWKSSYVRLVTAPSGTRYVVGCGIYTERMEPSFVVDAVAAAVADVERDGEAAFTRLRDPAGPYLVRDSYVFVADMHGVELVNPAFPTLEGRDLTGVTDAAGRYVVREMLELVRTRGEGWIDYLWPRPGESLVTRKTAYVRGATMQGRPVIVGCALYLPEAPQPSTGRRMTAAKLMALVRDAGSLLEERGEAAYAEFRMPDSRWRNDGTYLFALTMDGRRAFHAEEPETEGQDDRDRVDVLGRPIVRMILEAGASPSGEGWVHYMYPEPGRLYPAWKSAFVRRVTYPSGKPHVVGSGIYGLQLDRGFVEDIVDQAARLVERRGRDAFPALRDRRGPYVFMDTYVFVVSPEGVELVNPAAPSLEGRNNIELRDLDGRAVVRDEIAAAMQDGRAWVDLSWFRPGDNTPARKLTYVRRVDARGETFIVGSGIYAP